MDYVLGSVADLVAGNLTPSRPTAVKRAHTPVKHQPSPHVTPRADPLVDGRDALLSPSVLRKKAVVKKSPKRIFEKDDLDKTADGDTNSPKVEKVKKHLKAQLDNSEGNTAERLKAPKKETKAENVDSGIDAQLGTQEGDDVESEPKKKKKRRNKKKNKQNNDQKQTNEQESSVSAVVTLTKSTTEEVIIKTGKKKNKRKNKTKQNADNNGGKAELKTLKADSDKNGSDSEHESDNEIESETEQDVKQILDSGPIEGDNSSDEEEQVKPKNPKSKPKKPKEKNKRTETPASEEDVAKRTLFVGNVPLSKKCKKEIRQIFNKYGTIETVRIRAVPVKDLRLGPKVALIKNEIHPERSSVNVYIKFSEEDSVTKALSENNRLMGEHRVRVTRSDTSGVQGDPRRTVFLGNVPFGIEDDELRAKFERCGAVESVRIVRDRVSQIGKGFGYVNFASTDGVELALSLSEEDLTIKNRIMRVRRYAQAPPGQKVKGQFQNPNSRFNKQGGRSDRNGNDGQWNKGVGGGFAKGKPPRDDSGALKRINNKRKFQDNPSAGGAGPPQKKQRNLDQPIKEKKAKKEFVGLTAEKKKKKKFDKGQKNKKKLSEILTKS